MNIGDPSVVSSSFYEVQTCPVCVEDENNATVPEDAPIQPPQAFVDNIELFGNYDPDPVGIDLSDKDITFVSAAALLKWGQHYSFDGNTPYFDLSGNALTLAAIDGILAALAPEAGNTINGNVTVDLSGGTNAEPTVNAATHIFIQGWEVCDAIGTLNGRPRYQAVSDILFFVEWTGTQWEVFFEILRFSSTDNVATPDLVTTWTPEGALAPDFVVPVNASLQALFTAGWTSIVKINGNTITISP